MIVAFSTSSPLSSVALIEEGGSVAWAGEREAPGRASEACMELLLTGLGQTGSNLKNASLFVSDLGPGSFTGVRVGIVLVKTLAWNYRVQAAGLSAFDLVDLDAPVAIPSRKGEYLLRIRDEVPILARELPFDAVGWGFDGQTRYPQAAHAALSLARLERLDPMLLVPKYLAEPSISTPKRPLSRIPV